MDPDMRADPMFVKKLVRVTEHPGKFSDHELEDFAVPFQALKALTDISEYNETSDQSDIFWLGICRKVEKVIKEKPEALLKLVKIVCSLLLFLREAFRTLRGSSLAESCFLLSLSRLTRPSLISSDSQGWTEGVGVSQEMI